MNAVTLPQRYAQRNLEAAIESLSLLIQDARNGALPPALSVDVLTPMWAALERAAQNRRVLIAQEDGCDPDMNA